MVGNDTVNAVDISGLLPLYGPSWESLIYARIECECRFQIHCEAICPEEGLVEESVMISSYAESRPFLYGSRGKYGMITPLEQSEDTINNIKSYYKTTRADADLALAEKLLDRFNKDALGCPQGFDEIGRDQGGECSCELVIIEAVRSWH